MIKIRGARQHTLKNLNLDIALNSLTVITGVSGSGKSTLAFETLFAEGQRRYIETFSPYVRQFLAQMDRPEVDSIEGVPPAVAIEQYNPVRSSRSSVGTMTEINDYLKLLFARHSQVICPDCDVPAVLGNSDNIADSILNNPEKFPRVQISFRLPKPENIEEDTLRELLSSQGYTRFNWDKTYIYITQDRLRVDADNPDTRARLIEAVEHALAHGDGLVMATPVHADKSLGEPAHFVRGLSCPCCSKTFALPTPNTFSYNAPSGACETCKGFGRVVGIDYDLVIPDHGLSLAEGAIKPWQTPSNAKIQRELIKYAKAEGIDIDTPWSSLSAAEQQWIIEGESNRKGRKNTTWYGVKAFFDYWEKKSYKMHVRIQLAKYRSYRTCSACGGTRLKPESLYWHLPTQNTHTSLGNKHGVNCADVQAASVCQLKALIDQLALTAKSESATQLFDEIQRRLNYLTEVGLGYLTLDRQTRTLSGGEVQRINLTTALGSSLTHTLFVLDEPTVGLHAEEVERIISIMHKLRDAGNTLVVVEHDPAVMMAADHIIDMGPAAGEKGGEILFSGSPSELLTAKTPTADYLRLERRIRLPSHTAGSSLAAEKAKKVNEISLRGIYLHNLHGINAHFPLNGMTIVTGVSGSGKSTLVSDVLYPAYQRWRGERTEFFAEIDETSGFEQLEDMVLVDQTPIGKSARSNPISYVGAYEGIRQCFAKLPESIEMGFTASTFSFNSGNGRCATCQGNGFEQVEMQFMSDIYLRCPDCDGTRFTATTRAIRYYSSCTEQSYSINEVLDLTIEQALSVFAGSPKICRALQPLSDVGLQYLTLGQPVPTLSGGEAQRLKLAKFLASKRKKGQTKPTLYILDEPTTGLHLSDIDTLLAALEKILEAGDALLIVEHHLSVIRRANHIIELGPAAGDEGGKIIFAGTPKDAAKQKTATGKALSTAQDQQVAEPAAHYARGNAPQSISVIQAREHNLKNLSVDVPHRQMVAITGVSGSGKSTLAFSILFAEGQRRYLESLNAFSRQFVQPPPRPEVDGLLGMPPAIAIEQRTSRGGQKSTVATLTEIYHYLRQIYLLLGEQYCPSCEVPIHAQTQAQVTQQILKIAVGKNVTLLAPLVVERKGLYKELASWAADNDFATLLVDGEPTSTADWPQLDRFVEHTIDLPVATLKLPKSSTDTLNALLHRTLDLGHGHLKVAIEDNPEAIHFATARACSSCGLSFAEPDPRLLSYNSKRGWCTTCEGNGVVDDETKTPCPSCNGQRLNPIARALRFREQNIADLCEKGIVTLAAWFDKLKLNAREQTIAARLITEIQARLDFLQRVGLGYLSLDRAAPTLSGGEAQRIRLAAQLGANMNGACYVLDEPTIGLHARDNRQLIHALQDLVAQDNTVIVVEHDEETIRAADHIIDIGPGAGVLGGTVVAEGTLADICAAEHSRTGQQLSKTAQERHAAHQPRSTTRKDTALNLSGATLHNLSDITLNLPLSRLVGIAGVSGSGKSTLIRHVLEPNLRARLENPTAKIIHAASLDNANNIGRVLEVDQTPIGRTPRSTPATYLGIWDDIRKQLANTQEAKLRGWTASRFSFNNKEGCCPDCNGQGEIKIEMNFLPDVREPCQRCNGMRFNQETLQVKLRGKSAGEILDMPVDDALAYFQAHPKTHYALSLLQAVGLGYLKLGQPSSTLSGGEAQRIKLVTELAKAKSRSAKGAPHTLYLLDEPTVGLHMSDVDKLITVLHQLVDTGHSVIVIEHNTDLLRACDWLIELGPEGGESGGKIIAEGMPSKLINSQKKTATLKALRE